MSDLRAGLLEEARRRERMFANAWKHRQRTAAADRGSPRETRNRKEEVGLDGAIQSPVKAGKDCRRSKNENQKKRRSVSEVKNSPHAPLLPRLAVCRYDVNFPGLFLMSQIDLNNRRGNWVGTE